MFSLVPVKISGVKLIRLSHKLSCDYYNSSLSKAPLFWDRKVAEGTIDIPGELKKVRTRIKAEDIYTLKDLSVNEKIVFFDKSIYYLNMHQIAYQVTCGKIAKPGENYHISFTEEGLYNYDYDYFEEEIRNLQQAIVITVEKPRDLDVNVTTFGQDARSHVLEDSPRTYCCEIRGKLTSGNGISLHWRNDGRIRDIAKRSEEGACQQTVVKEVRDIKNEIKEQKRISQKILETVERNPEHIRALLNEKTDELRQILLTTADETKDKDSSKANKARKWLRRLERGISVTADLIQLLTFLTGIPSARPIFNQLIEKSSASLE